MPNSSKKKAVIDAVEAKRKLRVEATAARVALHRAIGGSAPLVVRDLFMAGVPLGPSAVVGGYWPMGAEFDSRPLLEELHARGHDCALAVVAGRGRPLVFRRWRPDDPLVKGVFGTSHPEPEREALTPDALIVPLLAFDAAGHRVGYGGGYYDRTITALRRAKPEFLAVGVAFAAQEWPMVPYESFDEPLDWAVTEKGARKLGA